MPRKEPVPSLSTVAKRRTLLVPLEIGLAQGVSAQLFCRRRPREESYPALEGNGGRRTVSIWRVAPSIAVMPMP
ncbi:hypothetical protein MPLA_680056 [Mesorhizobium sp. ORS 3359]|nr:hypothetical protein MPLA_680056 [Mesorhizobium sp. ORS 3359]